MEILKSNRNYLATMGITRHQAIQWQPSNAIILLQFLKFGLFAISFGGFFVFKANNFKEYTKTIYFLSAVIGTAVIFLIFVWHMKYIFSFIDGWEKLINER